MQVRIWTNGTGGVWNHKFTGVEDVQQDDNYVALVQEGKTISFNHDAIDRVEIHEDS